METITTAQLFDPVSVGLLELKNRVVMAPMTRTRAGELGIPEAMHATYYAQRAGAGLLITEGANISPQARGYIGTPGIWNEAQIKGWSAVTEAVHAAGSKIVLQLWHVGRISHVDLQPEGADPVAPSALRSTGNVYTAEGFVQASMPRALAIEEMADIIAQYRTAAENAKRAGFDGVEVHAANEYLLDQFIRDSTNHRDDAYGGSVENRARLVLEVTQAVIDVWGPGRVGIRLSPLSSQLVNTPLDSDVMGTYGYIIDQLNDFGLAYLHFVEGSPAGDRPNPQEADLDTLRARFKGPFIGNNGYDLDLATTRLQEGRIDLVAFGRPFISNPDLVQRLRTGTALTAPDPNTFYGDTEMGLTDWPVTSAK
jgi:N-ethylmaleimide reductase